MNHLKKTVFAALFLAVALFAGTVNVFAEGLSVTADKEECATGEAFTVTIDASSVGDGTIPPDIQVEFDSNRLNFENCSAEYGGGGGGLVTFKDTKATVDFTTLSGGAAEVKVTATADDAASPETASVSVSVSGEDTAALEAQSTSSTGVSPGTVDIGDGRVVQAVFSDEFMPPIFHKEVTEYNGQTVECAKFDMGDIVLLYTSDAAGNDGNLMMFNAVTGELSYYRMIRGIENRFIIVLSDCEGPVPDGYIKAVLEWDNQTLTAFMENSVAEGTSAAVGGVDPADFFLVYAVSSEGNKGWYRYDKNEGTYQRFISTGDSGAEGTPEGGDDETSSSAGILDDYIPSNVQSIIALICAPLVLILIITVIILAVKYHGLSEDFEAYFEGEGYYGDEEDEEEQYTRRPSRAGAVTASSLVERSMSEDEEEEDEDEEDDEDVDVEEDDTDEDDADEDDADEEEEEDEEEEDDEDDREGCNDDEDDVKYYRPLTRKERRELAREERWREKEEKKAAKRRAKGYEEATPMDWSSFGKEMEDEPDDRRYKKSKPPKYMTQSMEDIPEDDEEEDVDRSARKSQLPPRKKAERTEDEVEAPRVLHEEDMREKQRRLFEQQQRIEEQRRIENEEREAERLRQQQQFIASKDEELDLDEDFHFEFLNLD
ncbi:MAG: hypothetical protein K6E49_05995 [Lachnospiraceae bacterium]|nr:hypothetical protein [Lachnospiraceae bacterium]